MEYSILKKIVSEYITLGIIKGGELLLPPDQSINFLKDLEKIKIRVVGCDCWRYHNPKQQDNNILQIVGGGIGVEPPFEMTVSENARIIEKFIQCDLPKDAEFVSLIVEDPENLGPNSHLFYDLLDATI